MYINRESLMERTIYQRLKKWKQAENRKPLILQGARQVGKTFLLKSFAKREYRTYCYINFEENPLFKTFFQGSLHPTIILQQLSLYLNKEILAHETLIIFDEIQECPESLTSLKYFYEEANQYHVIGAGSLLGVKMANHRSFPVGKVNFLFLYPFNFFEFLMALEKSSLKNYLENYNCSDPLPIAIHEQLLQLLYLYIFIGGMPEAIKSYRDSQNPAEVRKIQDEILKAYLLDFAKHAPPQQINRISVVWNSIPTHLAKENKKFIFSAIAQSARAREYEAAIQWLLDAGLIYQSFNVTKPAFPLEHYAEKNNFKIFLFDVGLLGAMSQLPPQILLNNQILTEFKGALTENFVAQEFICSHTKSLYYWSSEGRAEVDFLITDDSKILPVEAKANISRKKKSLLVYDQKFNPAYLIRLSAMNFEKNTRIYNYPLYLTSKILSVLA